MDDIRELAKTGISEYIEKIYDGGFNQGVESVKNKILEFVRSDQFYESWVKCPKGMRFAEYFEQLLVELLGE